MVAPLTTAVMTSVPAYNSGLASAINNAISRIGPQLAGAVIFVAITSGFYTSLTQHAPSLDPNNPSVRQTISPLNRPPAGLDPAQAQAVRQASTDAMHLAMLFGVGLLLMGAAVSAIGIRNPQAPVVADAHGTPEEAHAPPLEEPSAPEPAQRPAEVPTG
jgi:hypothetical protein